jgi:hypothetical protein
MWILKAIGVAFWCSAVVVSFNLIFEREIFLSILIRVMNLRKKLQGGIKSESRNYDLP